MRLYEIACIVLTELSIFFLFHHTHTKMANSLLDLVQQWKRDFCENTLSIVDRDARTEGTFERTSFLFSTWPVKFSELNEFIQRELLLCTKSTQRIAWKKGIQEIGSILKLICKKIEEKCSEGIIRKLFGSWLPPDPPSEKLKHIIFMIPTILGDIISLFFQVDQYFESQRLLKFYKEELTKTINDVRPTLLAMLENLNKIIEELNNDEMFEILVRSCPLVLENEDLKKRVCLSFCNILTISSKSMNQVVLKQKLPIFINLARVCSVIAPFSSILKGINGSEKISFQELSRFQLDFGADFNCLKLPMVYVQLEDILSFVECIKTNNEKLMDFFHWIKQKDEDGGMDVLKKAIIASIDQLSLLQPRDEKFCNIVQHLGEIIILFFKIGPIYHHINETYCNCQFTCTEQIECFCGYKSVCKLFFNITNRIFKIQKSYELILQQIISKIISKEAVIKVEELCVLIEMKEAESRRHPRMEKTKFEENVRQTE